MTEYIQAITTVPSKAVAESIADCLLRERLAACVQTIGPIEGRYWWQGKLETAEEWQCVAKSRLSLFPRLQEAIRRTHPYEVPEILATPLETANADYLAWLDQQLAAE